MDISQIEVTHSAKQIGYVIQQSGLFPHIHDRRPKNIAVVPNLLGWSRKRSNSVEELLTLVEPPVAEYRRDRYPRNSPGQQQRVGFGGRWRQPKVMLMDDAWGFGCNYPQ
jgi:osmoprotectant transport system ATP-binding protein